jgi:hypothetical protein
MVVVCPTDHLKRQWAHAAARVGLELDPAASGGEREGSEYHGLVVTYQGLCRHAAAYRHYAREAATFVIFDEIHHVGDGLRWGEAVRTACEPAVRRLALSGTPFRSDAATIPYVRYVQGVSCADWTYGYEAAMRDRVCRPIYFPVYGGRVAWRTAAGTLVQATFEDPLPEAQSGERLRAAVWTPEWLRTPLVQMHQRLLAVREQHPSAGGLVIAQSQAHARAIARWMREWLGITPPVAISDDPTASATIARFARSREPWLVAVNMVSEGVDIPRLRVGVYATTIRTELYLRQAVGRFVRYDPTLGGVQAAYLALPADPLLVRGARAMATERAHVLGADGAATRPPSSETAPGSGRERPGLEPVGGLAQLTTWVWPCPAAPSGDLSLPGLSGDPPESPLAPRFEQRRALRAAHRRLVARVAAWRGCPPQEIHRALIRMTGGPIETATIEQLQRRLSILASWLGGAASLRGRPAVEP